MKTMLMFLLLMIAAGAAAAQDPISADGQVPPALRNRPAAPAATGAALRAQALAKLEAQFVAKNFDAIDAGRRGAVTFDDLSAYLARAKAERH
jgi:hypothetical protein